jgi:FkbM family methyltransferase
MILKIKILIARLLTSVWFNYILKIVNGTKIKRDSLVFDFILLPSSNTSYASFFWGFYESAEIRFIKKYIKNEFDVIECGSSIGIVSTYLGSIIKNYRLFCVEANEDLIPILKNNLLINGIKNSFIYNSLIGSGDYNLDYVKSSNNISGKLIVADGFISNKTNKFINLSSIVIENNIQKFNFVCDIEGAEYFILKESDQILSKINLIIIELHSNVEVDKTFTINQFVSELLSKGFVIIDTYYPVFVFKNAKE